MHFGGRPLGGRRSHLIWHQMKNARSKGIYRLPKRHWAVLFLLAALLTSGKTKSATVSTSFGTSANVQGVCFVTATALNFGVYNAGAGARLANNQARVRCSVGVPFTVALNAGTTVGATIAQRLLTNGTSNIQYNLYTTATLTTLFGNGTSGSVFSGVGAGLSNAQRINVNIFGRLPDNAFNSTATTGSYADTIGVTITY
jgi:spore coat protein U-like protein